MLDTGDHSLYIRKSPCANGETFEYSLRVSIRSTPLTLPSDPVLARGWLTPKSTEQELEFIRGLLNHA